MEVEYDLSQIFPDRPIQKLDRDALITLNPGRFWAVEKLINEMGELSAHAQGLKRALTTYQKIVDSDEDQKIYILWNKHPTKENCSLVFGYLKVGFKKLYLLEETARMQFEETPLCVLDFYVHENVQRQRNGHRLYYFMLKTEGVAPWSVAIDRPTTALLQFLEKFYKLGEPVWQNTNIVVFPKFFEDKKTVTKKVENDGYRRPAESEKHWNCSEQHSARSNCKGNQFDSVAGLIDGTAPMPKRIIAAPDSTPGRKNTYDSFPGLIGGTSPMPKQRNSSGDTSFGQKNTFDSVSGLIGGTSPTTDRRDSGRGTSFGKKNTFDSITGIIDGTAPMPEEPGTACAHTAMGRKCAFDSVSGLIDGTAPMPEEQGTACAHTAMGREHAFDSITGLIDGTAPMQEEPGTVCAHTAMGRKCAFDSVSGLINGPPPTCGRRNADPDTPLGKKNTRDFGHQMIW